MVMDIQFMKHMSLEIGIPANIITNKKQFNPIEVGPSDQ